MPSAARPAARVGNVQSAVNAKDWIAAYAGRLGVEPPTNEEFATLLDLAAEAAHASERVAAPVACWVAAGAGRSPEDALGDARAVTAEAAGEGGS